MIKSANDDGTWGAHVSAIAGEGTVSGFVTFSGPAGRTRRMGMCLVQRYGSDPDAVVCDTVDDCGSTPAELPTGGYRYCVAPDLSGTKYCHYRPGAAATYCVGTPALGGAEIAPGAYRKDVAAPAGTQWLSLACFEGCAVTPPAISLTVTVR